jgi:hypothetical protein
MNGRSRSWARYLATSALALTAGVTTLAAQGCLDRPVVEIKPGGSGLFIKKLRVTNVDKVDLLLMIDNSASMADKFTELGKRMPELIKALADPDIDPVTNQPKTTRVADLHVGIITSSLGSHGTSACDPATYGSHVDDKGHLMPRASENGTQGYTTDKVTGGTLTPVSCPAPVAASALTWAYLPAGGAKYTGQAQVGDMEASVACIVQSAKEDGCGYEAQLESIYHFLIDPQPYATADVVPACTKGASGDACGKGVITPTGQDDELLKERAAFLRPDSLLAVVMLTDENDGSINPSSVNWLPLAYAKGTMPKGWKACENVPDDLEPDGLFSPGDWDTLHKTYNCWSCLQPVKDSSGNVIPDPGGNCGTSWATTPLNNDVDGRNERMLQHTRRFGYNFLWGRKRYVDGFNSPTVPVWDAATNKYKYVGNPIYAGGIRTKDLVIVAGIVGVPKSLLRDDGQDLTEEQWGKIVGPYNDPDPSKNTRDPHMIEQIAPRTAYGIAKFAGDRNIDAVNGGDRDISDGDDLQYACIQARTGGTNPSRDCDAAGSGAKNPVCGPDASGKGTQPYFKAYPTLRELRVLHELQQAKVPAFVASLCADSYSPAIQGIITKLQAALGGQCLSSVLTVDATTGAAPCFVVESFASDAPKGAANCEALNPSGGYGYCTPGAEPCRIAGDTDPARQPTTPEAAAALLQLSISVTDPTTNAVVSETVTPVAENGNVYAVGKDSKRHLVCEMVQLPGNPKIPASVQTSCVSDATYKQTDGSGGWCYSQNADVVGKKCIAAGNIGTVRFLGIQPLGGSEVFTVCVNK